MTSPSYSDLTPMWQTSLIHGGATLQLPVLKESPANVRVPDTRTLWSHALIGNLKSDGFNVNGFNFVADWWMCVVKHPYPDFPSFSVVAWDGEGIKVFESGCGDSCSFSHRKSIIWWSDTDWCSDSFQWGCVVVSVQSARVLKLHVLHRGTLSRWNRSGPVGFSERES